MTTIGNTDVAIVGSSLHVKDFGSLNYLIEHALASFDPSVITLAAGALPITVPEGIQEPSFDDLAAYPGNKAIDLLMYLSLPPDVRAVVSTITTAQPLVQTEVTYDLIAKKKNVASVFLVNYLLHGTPRQMELQPPQVAKFLLDATGMKADEFKLPLISSLPTLGGFRSVKLVIHSIPIFSQGSDTLKSRMKKGFGGSRIFTIARAMRKKNHAVTSVHPEIRFFFDEMHDDQSPYVTFHPDHPMNPMKDHAQRVFLELANSYTNAGGSIDELAEEAPQVFIKGIVDRLKASQTVVTGDLPVMLELIKATAPMHSLKRSIV
jgi:hypothetical protein